MPNPTDQLLGTLAVRHGFVSEAQVQGLLRELPEGRSLGQLLLERGLIPADALPTLQRELSLARFLRAETGFVELCVEQGVLAQDEATALVAEQRRDGNTWRIGDRLVQQGRLDAPTRARLLQELFERLTGGEGDEPTASTIIRASEAGSPTSGVMRAVDADYGGPQAVDGPPANHRTMVLDAQDLPQPPQRPLRGAKGTKIMEGAPPRPSPAGAAPELTFVYDGDDEPAAPAPVPPAELGYRPPEVTPDMTFVYEDDEAPAGTIALPGPPRFGPPDEDQLLTAPIPNPFSQPEATFDAGGATMPIRRPSFGSARPPSRSDFDSDSDHDSGSNLGDTMADPVQDLTGVLLNNRYQILERIGQGGMGQVYRADHTLMGRVVAVKVLNPDLVRSEESVARFKREITTLAKFEHPNVVRLFDAGTTQNGRFYMAMEYVQGEPLSHVLRRRRRLDLQRFAALFAQVLQGVAKAHERGIVHRDLKTENLLVTKTDEGAEVVRIMDFGIAKLLNDESASGPSALTAERVAVGTPEYMSPEQAAGGAQVDHRSDLYSLGVVAFELLTGRLPFEAESPVGFIGKHIVDPPFTFEEAQPGLGHPPAIERFVLKALEKDPQHRYQSAEEMLDALEVALPKPIQDRLRQDRSSGVVPTVASRRPTPAPPRTSSGDELMANLLRLGIGLAALLTLTIGVALAYKTVTRRLPADEVLAGVDWRGDYLAGNFAEAKKQLEAAKALIKDEDQPAVEGFLQEIAQGKAAKDGLDAARTELRTALDQLDAALERGQHGPAEIALEQSRAARERVAAGRKALEAAGLEKLVGDPPAGLGNREESVALLLDLSTAAGLIVQGIHDRARAKLEGVLARTPPQSPVYARGRKLLAQAKALALLGEAEAELKKGAERRYDFARGRIDQAEKQARQESLSDVLGKARALLAELEKLEESDVLRRSAQEASAALARAEKARGARDYPTAIREYEAARALAREFHLGEIERKAEAERKTAELEGASLKAYEALPALSEEGELAALEQAIAAREAYVGAHPQGLGAEAVRAALPQLRKRLEARRKNAEQEAVANLLRQAKEAEQAGELRKAAELAAQASAAAKQAGLDSSEADALIKSSKDVLREKLVTAKLADFVKSGEIYVSRYEVSNNEYFRYVHALRKAGASLSAVYPAHWEEKEGSEIRFYKAGQGRNPVNNVSYQQAEAYCAWLTQEWRKEVPGIKVRLPSAKEWEAAAREGTQRAYPWGDAWEPDRVIHKRTDEEGTAAVRGEEVETLGGGTPKTKILHLAGNVAEWTSTPGEDEDGNPNPATRVLKGGSYRSFRAELLRIEARAQGGTTQAELNWGFRVVVAFE